jgi:hypothetical protein
MTPSPPNVTAMLRDWRNGNRQAQDQLFRAVYNELHRQAARHLRHEHPGLSLQTTDLIHEVYLRLRVHFAGAVLSSENKTKAGDCEQYLEYRKAFPRRVQPHQQLQAECVRP